MSQPQRKLAERAACSSSKPVRVLSLAVCMFAALSGAARAESLPARDECEEDPACADHVQAGLQLSKAGQYAAALVSYRAAHATRPVAWLLINIGRVLHRMGKPQQAIEHYRTYLQLAPGDDPERRRAAEGYLKQAASDLEPAPAVSTPATAGFSGKGPAPLFKRPWFWAVGGGTAAIAVGVTLGVVFGMPNPPFEAQQATSIRPNFSGLVITGVLP